MSEIFEGRTEIVDKEEELPNDISEKIKEGEFELKDLNDIDIQNHNKVALELINKGYFGFIIDNLSSFKKLSIDVLSNITNASYCERIAENVSSFVDSSHKEIAIMIIDDVGYDDYRRFNFFVKNIENFKGLDDEVALKLIEVGEVDFLERNLRYFNNLSQDVLSVLAEKQMGLKGRSVYLESGIGSFDKYDKNMALWLMENGFGNFVASDLDKVKGLDEEIMNIFIEWGRMGSNKYMSTAAEINLRLSKPNKVLDVAYSNFGRNLSYDIYSMYKNLDSGNLSSDMVEFGINEVGAFGVNKLRNKFREMQKELLNGELDTTLLLESSIARKWLMTITRYSLNDWIDEDEKAFVRRIEKYREVKDEHGKLPLGYRQSKVLNIDRVDKEKQEEFKLSEQFLSRYSTLLNSIKEARNLIEDEDGLNILIDRIKKKRNNLLKDINRKLDDPSKIESDIRLKMEGEKEEKIKKSLEFVIGNYEKQKRSLEQIDLESISHPQEIFSTLMSFKREFDEELRQLMFYASFYFNPKYKNISELDPDNSVINIDQLGRVIEFVDRVTNQETLKKYFTDKSASKNLKSLVNVSALRQEQLRWQNQAIKGTMSMKFIPSRDLLTEFSGYIADACWESEYDSILEQFPNFISLTIVKNPDDPGNERLVGSCLLIETESDKGNPLLVIRGLNPRENTINQLSTEDFYEKLINYLKSIAAKNVRKLAIVIDDHEGGSSTNRPVLFNYLDKKRSKLEKVKLKSNDDTEFNKYNIVNDCYLV